MDRDCMQWYPEGRDSDGVETVLVLYRDGHDSGLRVSRDPTTDVWRVTDGGTVVDAPLVGVFAEPERAKECAERTALTPRLWDTGYAVWESEHFPGAGL